MKKLIYLSALAVLLLAAGCKKEETITKALPKLKTVTYPTVPLTYTYTYDAQGRMAREDYGVGQHKNYTYTSSTVTVETYNGSGTITESVVYYLNAQSLADSSATNSGGTLSYAKYRYDAAGHLIETKGYNSTNTYSFIRYSVYVNGNQTDFYNTGADGTFLQHFTYLYDPSQANTTGNANKGLDFLGASSTNAYTRLVNVGPATFVEVSDNTYTYDSEGRITATETHYPSQTTHIGYTYY